MQVEFKIEPSTSGKTCNIAIHKKGEEKPFLVVKGFRMANGQNSPFLSGPSTKMDDGKWFNYIFMSKEFGGYITDMASKVMDAPKQSGGSDSDSIPF